MTDIIKFLENKGKLYVYTRVNIHVLYRYIEIIGSPKTLTTSDQRSHNFGPSSTINNDTATLQSFIAALLMRQNGICEWYGRIGHKVYACIIRVPKLLPPIFRININQFNTFHGDEPTETPREWNIQPTPDQFKPRTSPPKNSPVV